MVFSEKNYPLNAFRICADKVIDDVAGRAFCPLTAECIAFSGMGELLVKMDELFDRVGYPQAFQDKRSFDNDKERSNLYRGIPEKERASLDIVSQLGEQTTFDVLVNSRKNTSWQGSIYQVDGTFVSDFDGEIELLSALVRHSKI
ncbi:MAG: hypothetical protein KIG50_01615 [Lachnospiraceae bacterium]|nr:hypothetical protein [Lachnospiraceae bacterium]